MYKMTPEDILNIPEVSLHISYNKSGKPILEIRREFSNIDDIKNIINSAFLTEPILILPVVKSKITAINRLQEIGLIAFNSDKKKYEFLI